MEFKGTKGRWEAIRFSHEEYMIKSTDENNIRTDVGSVYVYSEADTESLANAKLIACAPELLEFIIELYNDREANSGLFPSQQIKLEQLIKKATE